MSEQHGTNPAREALTGAVNRAIAEGAPVYVEDPTAATVRAIREAHGCRCCGVEGTAEGRTMCAECLEAGCNAADYCRKAASS